MLGELTLLSQTEMIGKLGLSVADVAEIGGCAEAEARGIADGSVELPDDMRQALRDLRGDTQVIGDLVSRRAIRGDREFFLFDGNDDVRRHFPTWPGRGRSRGGFAGPCNFASQATARALRESNIEVRLVPYGRQCRDAPPVRESWKMLEFWITEEDVAEMQEEVDAIRAGRRPDWTKSVTLLPPRRPG